MSDELDPQSTPDEGQVEETGQGDQTQVPETAPDPGQAERERLAKLEQSYKEAHRTITRLTQKLSDYEKRGQPAEEAVPADAYFTDPVNTTKKVVAGVLSEFEARQEQKRQAERFLQDFAEERGIPVRQLQVLNDRLQSASSDPDAYLEMLARLHTAENTTTEIQRAAQSAKDSVIRNARAVTTESTNTQVSPPGKSFDDMSLAEQRAYLVKKYGEAPPEY